MPTPTAITDLSQTAASNFPQGSDSPSSLDDVQRAHGSFIAQLRDGKNFTNPVALASAATTDIGAQNALSVEISGAVTITSFGTSYNGPRFLRFTGALVLTHSSTLNLPGAANITTVAGDTCVAIPTQGATGWNVFAYQRSANTAGLATTATNIASGVAGAIPYQSAVGATGFSAAGTAGQALLSGGTGAPTWGSITAAQLQPITAAVASNAITITPSALSLDFRSATLTDGTVTRVSGTPSALVIAATDSFALVTAAGNQRIAILAINNAGTIELAASSLAGGVSLDETGVITTATAATLGTHIKAANVRTGVAYRVIGFIDATFTTATGWGSLAEVQGAGGNAITSMSSFGYGQTWQILAGSRTSGTTYYNTTGKPFAIYIFSNNSTPSFVVNGVTQQAATAGLNWLTYIIPAGASYSSVLSTVSTWNELR